MSKYKNNEVPGNARLSQALFDKVVWQCGMDVFKLHGRIEEMRDDDMFVKSIRFRFSETEGGDVMAIITADMQSGPMVAFHGASNLRDAITGLSARLVNGSLKWKEDQYG